MRRRTERECGFITHALTFTFCPAEPSLAPEQQRPSLAAAAHAPPTPTTATHGLAPRTTHSGAALGGLGTHGSAGGGRRQRHLVIGVVLVGGGGGRRCRWWPRTPPPTDDDKNTKTSDH